MSARGVLELVHGGGISGGGQLKTRVSGIYED